MTRLAFTVLAVVLWARAAVADCPRPSLLPSDVPLAGCPTAVEPEACTRCTKSQTHLRLSYAEAPTEMRGAWAHALGADDWKVSIRRARVDGGIATIVARKGHDRLTLVIMDAARFGGDGTAISLTFTPG